MAPRRLFVLFALVLVAGAVAWAITGLPGAPAACLPADCDCEAPGPDPIRQPVNAWSSLALAAAGIGALIVSPAGGRGSPPPPPRRLRIGPAEGATTTRLIAGGALVAAGVVAFLYHAGLTAWGARLDGIAVAILIGTLALHGFSYRLPRGAQRKPSPPALSRCRGRGSAPAAEGRGGGKEQQSPAGGGAATWARAMSAIAPWLLVALGGLCWWLGQSDGPWCRPGSLLQAHAAWHVLAAGAVGLWLDAEPGRTGPQVSPPSSLRAGEPDTQ
ncbi:MAG TPA: hypothetical protein VLS92_10670 [Acidimicrobiia bacterium]|nr:hypothetical protein [Acidimicrobiia bacterium]